jgi:hypothetical protein
MRNRSSTLTKIVKKRPENLNGKQKKDTRVSSLTVGVLVGLVVSEHSLDDEVPGALHLPPGQSEHVELPSLDHFPECHFIHSVS